MSAWHVRTPEGSGGRHPGRVWLLGPGSVVSVGLPPAQESCLAPVWANLASDWKQGPLKILVVSVGLPPEPGFALERVLGHQGLGCTGADLYAKFKELGNASKSDLVPVGGSDEEE